MFPARPPQQQPAPASDSSSGSNPSPTTAPSFTAFLVPPPMTVFVQLSGGLQLQFTPSPERLMSSLMGGVPVIFPVAGTPSSGGGSSFWTGMENEGMMRVMNELFMRSQSEQHGPPPTSKSFLEKLPLKTWNKEACVNEKYTDCAICLSEYETDDTVISLPCGHAFHKDCGMPWLVEHNVCPTCRHQLPTAQDELNKPATTTSTDSDNNNNNSNSSQDAQEGGGEPDEEPEGFEQMLRSLLGVRRSRSPTVSEPQPARVVRQRVEERESLLPGAVPSDASNNDGNDDDAMLDSMLEEEANRFVEEEKVKRVRQAPVDATSANDTAIFDEVDLEELLRDTRPPANCSAASTEA